MKHYYFSFFKIVFFFYLTVCQLQAHSQIVVNANTCANTELFDNTNPWTFGGTNASWSWANPNKLQITDDISIGGKALILGGNTTTSTYNTNENSWAMSPEYDLSAVNNPFLSFYFYWSNEGSTSYDEIWMEYSLNNGNTWTDLATPIGTGSCYDQNWYNYPDNWGGNVGGCFSGLGGPTDWVLVRKCINGLANEGSVRFRFRISTGSTCQNYGATVDNFKVCDATVTAAASYQCTPQPFEIEFIDESYECPTDWFWDFGDNQTSTAQNPIHTYTQAGVYAVTLIVQTSTAVTSGCGGPFFDTLQFDVSVFNIAVDTIINVSCFGANDGQAVLSSTGINTALDYSWTPAPGAGQNSNVGTGLTPNNYSVVGTDLNHPSCVANIAFNIIEPSQISAVINSINSSCTGICDGSINANINGGVAPYQVLWQPQNLQGSSIQNVCPGTYNLSITDTNGCVENIPNAAIVNAGLSPAIVETADQNSCQLTQTFIPAFNYNASSSGVTWEVLEGFDVGFGITGSGNIPTFVSLATNSIITVNIKVTPVGNGVCPGISDTFKLNIHPLPIAEFASADTMGCEPHDASFNLLNYQTNNNYFWNFGNGQISNSANGGIQTFNHGTFNVSLTVTSEYCGTTLKKHNYIKVNKSPKVNFVFSPDKIDRNSPIVNFKNLTDEASNYIWDFGDGMGASIIENPQYLYAYSDDEFYKVTLTASNGICEASLSQYIFFDEELLMYVPNAFSPNLGNNNTSFKPILASGIDVYDYEFSVFNQWGEIVFQSFDPNYGWNGCYGNNCEIPFGIYTWKIFYHLKNNAQKKEIYGTVLLLK